MLDPKEKARLSWHCRRGMLELDLMLQAFLEQQIDNLSPSQLKSFDLLLTQIDPLLFAWLMGHEEPQETEFKELVALIRHSN